MAFSGRNSRQGDYVSLENRLQDQQRSRGENRPNLANLVPLGTSSLTPLSMTAAQVLAEWESMRYLHPSPPGPYERPYPPTESSFWPPTGPGGSIIHSNWIGHDGDTRYVTSGREGSTVYIARGTTAGSNGGPARVVVTAHADMSSSGGSGERADVSNYIPPTVTAAGITHPSVYPGVYESFLKEKMAKDIKIEASKSSETWKEILAKKGSLNSATGAVKRKKAVYLTCFLAHVEDGVFEGDATFLGQHEIQVSTFPDGRVSATPSSETWASSQRAMGKIRQDCERILAEEHPHSSSLKEAFLVRDEGPYGKFSMVSASGESTHSSLPVYTSPVKSFSITQEGPKAWMRVFSVSTMEDGKRCLQGNLACALGKYLDDPGREGRKGLSLYSYNEIKVSHAEIDRYTSIDPFAFMKNAEIQTRGLCIAYISDEPCPIPARQMRKDVGEWLEVPEMAPMFLSDLPGLERDRDSDQGIATDEASWYSRLTPNDWLPSFSELDRARDRELERVRERAQATLRAGGVGIRT